MEIEVADLVFQTRQFSFRAYSFHFYDIFSLKKKLEKAHSKDSIFIFVSLAILVENSYI